MLCDTIPYCHFVSRLKWRNKLSSSITMPWIHSLLWTVYCSSNCEETFFHWRLCSSNGKWETQHGQPFRGLHSDLFQSLVPFPCHTLILSDKLFDFSFVCPCTGSLQATSLGECPCRYLHMYAEFMCVHVKQGFLLNKIFHHYALPEQHVLTSYFLAVKYDHVTHAGDTTFILAR